MNNKWTYEEVLLALYAYCHVPFNKANNSNPWIVKISKAIGRTPVAVKMKIGNLGAFDPALQSQGIVGLRKTSKVDEQVWNDYAGKWDKLALDAEKLLSEHGYGSVEGFLDLPVGSEKYYTAKRRINQDFFREAILSSYNSKCCISGITEPSLLEAAHIVSWSDDESIRTDPRNGLCLNPFFHKAFDNYLLTITDDLRVLLSERLLSAVDNTDTLQYLESIQHQQIITPQRFMPDTEYLSRHYEKFRAVN